RNVFERIALANLARLSSFERMLPGPVEYVVITDDARHILRPDTDLASLIVTSPPYISAQKYIRSSTLSLGWLGLAPNHKLRDLERLNIGREHFSKLEYKSIPKTFLQCA